MIALWWLMFENLTTPVYFGALTERLYYRSLNYLNICALEREANGPMMFDFDWRMSPELQNFFLQWFRTKSPLLMALTYLSLVSNCDAMMTPWLFLEKKKRTLTTLISGQPPSLSLISGQPPSLCEQATYDCFRSYLMRFLRGLAALQTEKWPV